MAYNNHLANRIRERLQYLPNIEEKEMMGGLVFMLNDKRCVAYLKARGCALFTLGGMKCHNDGLYQKADERVCAD